MARIGVGKIFNVGGSTCLRLPASLVNDKAFLFEDGKEVMVKITGRKSFVVSDDA
jgi:antitoxin component of MazEF toxin-antitoxin module